MERSGAGAIEGAGPAPTPSGRQHARRQAAAMVGAFTSNRPTSTSVRARLVHAPHARSRRRAASWSPLSRYRLAVGLCPRPRRYLANLNTRFYLARSLFFRRVRRTSSSILRPPGAPMRLVLVAPLTTQRARRRLRRACACARASASRACRPAARPLAPDLLGGMGPLLAVLAPDGRFDPAGSRSSSSSRRCCWSSRSSFSSTSPLGARSGAYENAWGGACLGAERCRPSAPQNPRPVRVRLTAPRNAWTRACGGPREQPRAGSTSSAACS